MVVPLPLLLGPRRHEPRFVLLAAVLTMAQRCFVVRFNFVYAGQMFSLKPVVGPPRRDRHLRAALQGHVVGLPALHAVARRGGHRRRRPHGRHAAVPHRSPRPRALFATRSDMNEKPYWNSYLAGLALGLVLLATFVVTGRGLGASGAMTRIAVVCGPPAPTPSVHGGTEAEPRTVAKQQRATCAQFFQGDGDPLDDFLVYMFVGVLIGGFLGGSSRSRFHPKVMRGPRTTDTRRLVFAVFGGGSSRPSARGSRAAAPRARRLTRRRHARASAAGSSCSWSSPAATPSPTSCGRSGRDGSHRPPGQGLRRSPRRPRRCIAVVLGIGFGFALEKAVLRQRQGARRPVVRLQLRRPARDVHGHRHGDARPLRPALPRRAQLRARSTSTRPTSGRRLVGGLIFGFGFAVRPALPGHAPWSACAPATATP